MKQRNNRHARTVPYGILDNTEAKLLSWQSTTTFFTLYITKLINLPVYHSCVAYEISAARWDTLLNALEKSKKITSVCLFL